MCAMIPSFVLLDRIAELSFKEEDDEAASVAAEKGKGTDFAPQTAKFKDDATVSFLGSMKPQVLLHRPPKISTLRLCSSRPRQDYLALYADPYASVACADKSMLVLYGGSYLGPGSSSRGCYLIFDAAVSGMSNLTSTVPPVPNLSDNNNVAPPAVVLHGQAPSSSYVLAELATTPQRDIPDADLYLWRSDSPPPQQWEVKAVRLPSEVRWETGKHEFLPDSSFSFGDSMCWVDLLRGIVVYKDQKDPSFRFIPLPDGCPEYGTSDHLHRPHMPQFRTAACVAGTIKFVAVEGFLEGWEFGHKYRVVSWTLAPDLEHWEKDGVFNVKDIWASDKFIALGIRHCTPCYPVLSPLGDGVVYVIVNHVEMVKITDSEYAQEVSLPEVKSQYVLGLDIQRNQIISTERRGTDDQMKLIRPELLAIEFGACLQGPKDHQSYVGYEDVKIVTVNEDVESGKRPRIY